jgi:uncharacterized protein YjbJ (UPF0337 family)
MRPPALVNQMRKSAHCRFNTNRGVQIMNWDQVKGKWTEFQGAAKEKWGALTDDDWAEIDGQREKLAGKLQAKYGKTKEQAEREIDEMAHRFN